MTETFQCASCSAPLEFEGTPIQKCGFCGGTVIVPYELFHRPSFDATSLTGVAANVAEIRRLIASGQKLMAIKLFRETFGVGLREAKDAVEAMERGIGVNLTGINVQQTPIRVSPEAVNTLKKVGFTIGGSIIGTTALIIVVTVGLVVGIVYMTLRRVGRAIDKSLSIQVPSKSTVAGPLRETLRFGGDGIGAGRFKDNRSVAVDSTGKTYSCEYGGGNMQVFDAEGKFLTQWPINQETPIRDIAADRAGNVAVLDGTSLYLFDGPTGQAKAKVEKFRADGIAFGPDGKLFVAERDDVSIRDLNLKSVIDLKGLKEKASAKMGFGRIAVSGDGSIFLADRQNGDLCKFSPDGRFLNRFPIESGQPNAIAIDPKGRIFIAKSSKIIVLDADGHNLASIPTTQVYGLTFDSAGEMIAASRPFIVRFAVGI